MVLTIRCSFYSRLDGPPIRCSIYCRKNGPTKGCSIYCRIDGPTIGQDGIDTGDCTGFRVL